MISGDSLTMEIPPPLMSGISAPPFIAVLKTQKQIYRDLLNNSNQFDLLEPFLANGFATEQRSQDVAGDGTGTVTVPAMVDGQTNAEIKIRAGSQSAINGDGQRLLPDPSFTHFLKGLRVRPNRSACSKFPGFNDGG